MCLYVGCVWGAVPHLTLFPRSVDRGGGKGRGERKREKEREDSRLLDF